MSESVAVETNSSEIDQKIIISHSAQIPDDLSLAIFDKMRAGEIVKYSDPEWPKFIAMCGKTTKLMSKLNQADSVDIVREILSEVIGSPIDPTTIIYAPFYTNFGRLTTIGKGVFINHACSFLDIGGITIEDNVLIGPRVNLVSENHPLDPAERQAILPGRVVIKKNAWIGAAATILPGVTIGENSVVAAGAVVSRDVPPNVVVAGVPAKIIKHL